MDSQTVQTIAEIAWKAGAAIVCAIFIAGMFYHRLKTIEGHLRELKSRVDDMPGREAAMRRDFEEANGAAHERIEELATEIKHDRKEAGSFREKVSEQLGRLVTRDNLDTALARTEERIGALFRTVVEQNARNGRA